MVSFMSPVPTTLTAFIGQTASGPRLTPTRVRDWNSYQTTFGAPTTSGLIDESVRLFMGNGGGQAVVISIGPASVPVTLPDLLAGLSMLEAEPEAAIVVAPDAVRLPADPQDPFRSSDFGQFADALLTACAKQGRFAILDVWGGDRATSGDGLAQVTTTFRSLVSQALDRGAAYLPWVVTSPEGRIFPPSGAVAGVYCRVDAERGVWRAPTNQALRGIQDLAYKMSDAEQGEINNKAVNGLRTFADRGLMVWGARTLDDNNLAWRYIPVRRTSTFIEQSIKRTIGQFTANDAKTWAAVRTMVIAFLDRLWRQGALLGATQDEAYSVQCGLGSTMTEQDILDGYMIVEVLVALVQPGEFIVLTIRQRMGGA